MKIPASVGILTFNSAGTLRRALESVRDFDDVVICDGGSTDGTLDIARAFGARVIRQLAEYKNSDGTLCDYAGVRNQLLDAARYDWFLYIDSDETASDGLCKEVAAAVAGSVPLVYRVPIGIIMDGRYIKHSTNYPGYQHRFFNRLCGARFKRPVHERIAFGPEVRVGTFAHPWYVHTTREYWRHYVRETAGYRPIEVSKSCAQPWHAVFVHTVLWHLRVSLAVLIKAAYLYARYGFTDTLPVRGELGRVLAPLVLIRQVIVCKIKKYIS